MNETAEERTIPRFMFLPSDILKILMKGGQKGNWECKYCIDQHLQLNKCVLLLILTQTQHVVESTGVLNNHGTFF